MLQTAPFGDAQVGLEGDDHVRFEHDVRPGVERRLLMRPEAEAVADAAGDVIAVAEPIVLSPGGQEEIPDGRARLQAISRPFVYPQAGAAGPALLVRDLLDRDRPPFLDLLA